MKFKNILFGAIAWVIFQLTPLNAQWQPTTFNQSTWVFGQTENGNMIATNDIYPDLGGAFISQDHGQTWQEATAEENAYTAYVVQSSSIYLGGTAGKVARSHDNGLTWSTLDFGSLIPGISENDAIYALEFLNDRLYVSVFGIGVVFTEDDGASWQLTDVESLYEINNPEDGGQWTYDLRSFNGSLYNLSAFGIWKYNESEDLWSKVDDRWYPGSSLVVDDTFYAVYNAAGIPDGIRYTTDFVEWQSMPIPAGASTSIRFLKYFNGAFFMGHVNEAILYSVDHGENWIEYREDFPFFTPIPGLDVYGTPMNLVFSEDSLFCAVFATAPGVGGVYKAPIPNELLSTNEISMASFLKVYPNPATDFVTFEFSKDQKFSGNLQITNVNGKVFYSSNVNENNQNKMTISTSSWPTGLYFYSINSNKLKFAGKIIVK